MVTKAYVDEGDQDGKDAIELLNEVVPAQASEDNQLADKNFVNSSIENIAAYYITKDAAGNPFATKAELNSATVFYSGGVVRTPTRNDYCVVLADESKTIAETGENPTTRYLYYNGWNYQYVVNNSGLTAAQWASVNSNITASKVTEINSFMASKGAASGVASLDSNGKVPSTQLPAMDYIPTSEKGAANGVASLGADGKIPTSQLPVYDGTVE